MTRPKRHQMSYGAWLVPCECEHVTSGHIADGHDDVDLVEAILRYDADMDEYEVQAWWGMARDDMAGATPMEVGMADGYRMIELARRIAVIATTTRKELDRPGWRPPSDGTAPTIP